MRTSGIGPWRGRPLGLALAFLLGLTLVVLPGAAGATLTWGTGVEVAGSINAGGDAEIQSVSCSSEGNCSAGGFYEDGSSDYQAFVVDEVSGTWGTASEVAASLNADGEAGIDSISCSSAGNCAAGGYYEDGSSDYQAFVVDEVNGTWGTASEVAASLHASDQPAVNSVSCSSAGNCSAGGDYVDGSGNEQAFVVNEVSGTWGAASEVAASLNADGDAAVISVSCSSAGNCSAGGYYEDGSSNYQAFVLNEVSGTWGAASEMAASLNARGDAEVESMSCSSAGNCSAGGYYEDGSNHQQAFVVDEASGTWGTPSEVAGSLNARGDAAVESVSCSSAGNCAAGGSYEDGSFDYQAFAVDEVNGTWGTPSEVARSLNAGGDAGIVSVSCSSAGTCAAGGSYKDRSSDYQALVVDAQFAAAVSVTNNSVTAGGTLVFTATVTGSSGGPSPTGTGGWTVTAPGGGSGSCSATSGPSGSANVATYTCSVAGAAAGTYQASFSYPGDSTYGAASGTDTTANVASPSTGSGTSSTTTTTTTTTTSPSTGPASSTCFCGNASAASSGSLSYESAASATVRASSSTTLVESAALKPDPLTRKMTHLEVTVDCVSGSKCVGSLGVTLGDQAKKHGKTTTTHPKVASGSFTIAVGAHKTIAMTLTKLGKSLAAKATAKHRLRATVTVKLTGGQLRTATIELS